MGRTPTINSEPIIYPGDIWSRLEPWPDGLLVNYVALSSRVLCLWLFAGDSLGLVMRRAGSFLCDALLIVAFAVLGNRAHDSGLAPVDVLATAWPFLVGLTVGWLVTASWSRPHQIWPAGLLVVVVTVVVGMVLRHLFTPGGVQLSFVLVATATLAVFLLGRRLIGLLMIRR